MPTIEPSQVLFPSDCPHRLEPWSCALGAQLVDTQSVSYGCRTDVAKIAVAAFNVIEVVEVVGYRTGQFHAGLPARVLSSSTRIRAQKNSMAALPMRNPRWYRATRVNHG